MKKENKCLSLAEITLKQFEKSLVSIKAYLKNENKNDLNKNDIWIVDYVLEYWLEDMEEYEREEELFGFMGVMISVLKADYSFSGELYKGMAAQIKTREKGLKEKKYSSYTDILEIAKHFAGLSEEYGLSKTKNEWREVFKIEVKDAFAFDEFLEDYLEISQSESLINQIEEKLYENEKIYNFDPLNVTKILDAVS